MASVFAVASLGAAPAAAALPEGVFEVTFTSGTEDVPALMAKPKGSLPRPAVIVLHANSLHEPYIAETVAQLAKNDFVPLAIDVFHFLPRRSWEEFQKIPSATIGAELDKGFTEARLVKDVQAGINYLHGLPYVKASGVGIVGFCGGGWNGLLVAAQSRDVHAVVAFYAPVKRSDPKRRAPIDLATFLTMPIQFHRASTDPDVPAADVEGFGTALRKNGTPMEVFFYEAKHGFAATNRTGIYDPKAAKLAWTRAFNFLDNHLGGPISPRPLAPAWKPPSGSSTPAPGSWLLHDH
jgi:carboxymethylenebutenolidase